MSTWFGGYALLARIRTIKQLLGILRLRDTPTIRGGQEGLLGVRFVFVDDLVVVLGVLDAMVN